MKSTFALVLTTICIITTGCISRPSLIVRQDAPYDEETEFGDFDEETDLEKKTPHFYPKDDKWYGQFLITMQEPSLYAARKEKSIEAYRFLYLPSFGNPLCIRLVRDKDEFWVKSIKLSGKGGYYSGKISYLRINRIKADVLPKAFAELTKKIVWDPNFRPKKDVQGLDGTQWVLEGLKNGKYSYLDIWSADYETEERGLSDFKKLCEILLYRIVKPPSSIFSMSVWSSAESDPLGFGFDEPEIEQEPDSAE